MEATIDTLRLIHVVVGFLGLAAFWVPVMSRKGGARHKQLGKVFALAGYVVAGTAITTTTLRLVHALLTGSALSASPEAVGMFLFLGYLGWVTLAYVHHGVRTVRTRRDPDAIRTRLHRLLAIVPAIGSLVVGGYALLKWSSVSVVLLALSPLGVICLHDLWRYMYHRPAHKMAWFFAHMSAMLGAGVAFHTAFVVFGAARWLSWPVLGPYNWLPWVLPAALGVIGETAWKRHYRRKFQAAAASR